MKLYPDNLDSIPLLPYTLLYAAGIVISPVCGSTWVWMALFAVVILLIIAKRVMVAAWTAALMLGIIGAALSKPTSADVDNVLTANEFSGYITSVKDNDNGTSAIVRLSSPAPRQGSAAVKIYIPEFNVDVEEGMEIRFRGSLSNQYPEPDLPYETDYAELDRRNGIVAGGYITSDSIISIEPSTSLRGYFAGLRGQLRRFILRRPVDPQLKEFLVAVLLGDTTLISEDTRQAFSEVGLSHIIAISGLHIAIITMLLSLALWPMQRLGAGRWRPIPIMLLLWGYACITGLSPSVTRAVIMASVYIIGRLTERRASPYNSLCLAALLILIVSPDDIYSIGFQLSFAAVLSILLFANAFNPVIPRKRILYTAVGYVTVTLAAVIGTFAISSLYFHIFPLNFLPANIICALLFPVLLGCSIVGLLLSALGLDATFVYHLCEWLYGLIQSAVGWLQNLGPAPVTGLYFSAWCLLPVGIGMAALKIWIESRKWIWSGVVVACGVSALLVASLLAEPPLQPCVYASRHGLRTDFIVDGADGVMRIITTRPNEPVAVRHDAAVRYRDFIGRQGIDSIDVVTAKVGEYGSFVVNHQIIAFPAFSMAIVSSVPIQTTDVDYAVICRGFSSSIDEVMDCYRPDTIILSRDLHPRTLSRLKEDCAQRDIPYISLRERPWSRAL